MLSKEEESAHFSKAYGLETSEETRLHYKSWAKTYDLEIGEHGKYAQPARAAEMLQRFQPNKSISIFDAGCGSGLSGEALVQFGYSQIHGCDFSADMLEIAKTKSIYKSLNLSDLNAGQSHIPNSTYDAVCAVGVFSFGHVSPDACDDLLRILKPGGHLIIALNEQFWEKGHLQIKLDQLQVDQKIEILAKEFGAHLPQQNIMGWVIAAQKR